MSDESAIFRCDVCRQLNRITLEKVMQESKLRCGTCKSALDIPREPVWAKRGTFDRVVAHWPETLLVEFVASICVHCKIIDPVVIKLAHEKTGKLKVIKVDSEMDSYLTQRFNIEKTPTFILYKNGEELSRMDGAPKEKADLVAWVEKSINETND